MSTAVGTTTTTTSRERILLAATELFAQHGYDATSTRTIADTVGLNIATVAYHVGSKPELYRTVMRQAHEAQGAAMSAPLAALAAAGTDPEQVRAAMRAFTDAYLDFCLAAPHIPALWMRRWLAEGAEGSELVADIEVDYVGPLVQRVSSVVQDVLDGAGLAAGLDVDLLVLTVVWTSHSFVMAGLIDHSGQRRPAVDPATLTRFRRHLHDLVERLVDRG